MKDEKKSRKELLAEIQSLRMENSRLKKGLMRTNSTILIVDRKSVV